MRAVAGGFVALDEPAGWILRAVEQQRGTGDGRVADAEAKQNVDHGWHAGQ